MPTNHRLGPYALAALISLAAPCGVVWAQAPTTEIPAAPHFDIIRFNVVGNTLLKPDEIERVVAPYVGKQKDFADIQRALESLEQEYRDRGYGVVQVLLPEQDITRGVVQLRVIEPRIGKVVIEGNQRYDEANIRRSLPSLKPGTIPDSLAIARNLQLLGENPAKQTTVLLKAGTTDNEVDATVKVVEDRPYKFSATLDNTGTRETGNYRTGIGFQHANLWNRDHVFNAQFITSPDHVADVKIYGAGYHIPLYAWNSSLDFFAGYSNVNSGAVAGLFNVSGAGTILGARYNYILPKHGEYEQKLAFGLDYRAFQNNILTTGGLPLLGDVTIHPVSITYTGLWRMTNREIAMYFSAVQNVPGGNDGADRDFKGTEVDPTLPAQRADARASYRIYRYGATFTQRFANDWQARAVFNGQFTGDALVLGEQFGFGGSDSVRGFNLREVANDKGYWGSVELYTPELGSKLGWKSQDARLRALVFYDWGDSARNSPQPGDPSAQSAASVGFGLRFGYGKSVSARADYGVVVDPAGKQSRHDQMLHFSLGFVF